MKLVSFSVLVIFLMLNSSCLLITKKKNNPDGTQTVDTVPAGQTTSGCVSGSVDNRTMYKLGADPCETEKQTRICENGIWGSWSGSYTAFSCPKLNKSVLNTFFFN